MLGKVRDWSRWNYRWMIINFLIIIIWHHVVFFIGFSTVLRRKNLDVLLIDSANDSVISLILNVWIIIIFNRSLQYFNFRVLTLSIMILTKSSWHTLGTQCLCCFFLNIVHYSSDANLHILYFLCNLNFSKIWINNKTHTLSLFLLESHFLSHEKILCFFSV